MARLPLARESSELEQQYDVFNNRDSNNKNHLSLARAIVFHYMLAIAVDRSFL